MTRVCLMVSLLLSSGCTAEDIRPSTAIARQIGDALPGKRILACTGLPLGGEKCGLELPKLNCGTASN